MHIEFGLEFSHKVGSLFFTDVLSVLEVRVEELQKLVVMFRVGPAERQLVRLRVFR